MIIRAQISSPSLRLVPTGFSLWMKLQSLPHPQVNSHPKKNKKWTHEAVVLVDILF